METVLLYLILGAFAGTMAGLLGVGGGLIIVPVLAYVYRTTGFDETIIMHLAIGTSLATIVITSISSLISHYRHGAIMWPVFWRLSFGIVIGAWIGAWSAAHLAGDALQKFFGLFELLIALQMLSGIKAPAHHVLPGSWGLGIAGTGIGVVSAILGIGGGSLTVGLRES